MLWLQDVMTASPPTGETVTGIDVFVSQFLTNLISEITTSGEQGLLRSIPCSRANSQITGTSLERVCVDTRFQLRLFLNRCLDIDELSLQFANDNVKKNGLESRIRIGQSLPNDPILKSLFEDETFRCDSLVKS